MIRSAAAISGRIIAPRLLILVVAFAAAGCLPSAKLSSAEVFAIELKMGTPQGPVRVVNEIMAFEYQVTPERQHECTIGMITLPCGGGTKLGGEAIAIPVKGGRTLFVLLTGPDNPQWPAYARSLLDGGKAACAKGQTPGCDVPADKLPFMVVFKDPKDPRSAVRVDPDHPSDVLGPGYSFIGLRVQPGGGAGYSIACAQAGPAAARLEAQLPFLGSLRSRSPDGAQQYALLDAVTDRNSFILGPLDCEEARGD